MKTERIEKPPASEEIAVFLENLRAGRKVMVVDDHESSCRLAGSILSNSYPDLTTETNAQTALDTICRRSAAGELDVLILDMDMPGITGREILIEMAKRNVFVPTVIYSGGQGTKESLKFLSQLSAAQTQQELTGAIAKRLKTTQGTALVYVPKEVSVVNPEILVTAVDAMVLAGKNKIDHLDLLIKTEKQPAMGISSTRLHQLWAALADECVAFIYEHNRYCEEFTMLAKKIRPDWAEDESISELISSLGKIPVLLYTYDEWADIKSSNEFEFTNHELMGSRGLQGFFSNIRELDEILAETEFNQLFQKYFESAGKFISSYREISDKVFQAFNGKVELGEIINELSRELALEFAVEGEETVVQKGEKLKMAITQALNNARQALADRKDGQIKVRYGQDKGKETAFIEISDNGGGIPNEVLQAWNENRKITSTKTGKEGFGLMLMRAIMETIEGGEVIIERVDNGTRVTLRFSIN